MSDATLTQPYGVAVRLEAEPDEIETEISMRRTALLLTVASLALAGCWDDETADDETTATTEELAAAPSQSQTQALDGELPIETATSEQQLTDENAAALSEALAEADAERASLMAQRVALEDEIASLRAESASRARALQDSRTNADAREAAIRAELAAQRAEAALAELNVEPNATDSTSEPVQTAEDLAPERLKPYLGAWAQDVDARTPDWVIGPDFLIWSGGACTITPTDVTARFALSDCRGGAQIDIVDLRIADDILTVIVNERQFILNEVEIR